MRILLIFILSFFLFSALGQTKSDTINILELKAREYLKQTYSNQDFDFAVSKWHEFIFSDAKEIYKKKGFIFSNRQELLKKIKEDYKIFYSSNIDFALINFTDEGISDESKKPTVYFKYSYCEKVNGKDSVGSSYLYFVFDDKTSEWKIWDFRISDVLGDPTRWLK